MTSSEPKPIVEKISTIIDLGIFTGALFTLAWWLTGVGVFYTDEGPVLSPFTSLSLALMAGSRLAPHHLTRWPMPLTLAWLGIVIGGNVSSIMVQMTIPDLFLHAFPGLVMTSIVTSLGIILFCGYQILVTIRDKPEKGFIVDDILLHLALVPGCVSLLGHWLGKNAYISSSVDPRIGISLLEMVFMAAFAAAAALSNPHLFLWRFLKESHTNKLIFFGLCANQFIAPLFVAWLLPTQQATEMGIDLYVMLAGIIATLSFLSVSAYLRRADPLASS